ncbi:MAG: DEAD/DEAH box helicase [Planctomycetota bacterium]|nr:DEAD/DEAH box helicase [Planctomycetota bacterium]
MPHTSSTPFNDFDELGLAAPLAQAIAKAQYEKPRPIQAETIPPALAGRDVLGLAQTGTGKTAAFAIPCIEHLLAHRKKGPRVLVIGPTRELVTQIDDEFRKLTARTKIRTMTIYGGISEKPQIQKLERHPDVVCACPGRLLDLLGRGFVDLSRIETLILDEADHMFDMGFLPDIRRIIQQLPDKRQNLLFAATMPKEIRKLAEQILVDPFVSEIDHSVPAKTIEHALYPVREKRKIEMLRHFLRQDDFESAIVFTRTKRRARQLAQKLEKDGHRAIALQGNMSQNQRDRAMSGFRKRNYDILVATDVAARGIDVQSVSHVINLDIPNVAETYTHRIGRTGRSEQEGKAYTFITEEDGEMIAAIEKMIGMTLKIESVPGFEEVFIPKKTGRPRGGNRGRNTPATGAGSRRKRSGRRKPATSSRPARRRNPQSADSQESVGAPKRRRRRRKNSGTRQHSNAGSSSSGSSGTHSRRSSGSRKPTAQKPR